MLTDEHVVDTADEPKAPSYVTLESIDQITVVEEDVEIEGVGTFRVRAMTMGQTLQMQEAIGGDVEDVSERDATRAMLRFGLVQPSLPDDAAADRLIDYLLPGQVTALVERVTEISGMEQDDEKKGTVSFSDDSPTG